MTSQNGQGCDGSGVRLARPPHATDAVGTGIGTAVTATASTHELKLLSETVRERELLQLVVTTRMKFEREWRVALEPIERELAEIRARKSRLTLVK